MRYSTLLSFLLVFLLAAGAASAQDLDFVDDLEFDLVGGLGYTTFADADLADNLSSALGFYAGLRVGITEELFVIGQYERYSASHGNQSLVLGAPVILVGYNVAENINFYGGTGYYTGEREAAFKGSLGYKIGAGVEYEIVPDINLLANANYRMLNVDEAGDPLDLSGPELSVGVAYAF